MTLDQVNFGVYSTVGQATVDAARAVAFAEITGAPPPQAVASPLFGVCLARPAFTHALSLALRPEIGERVPVLHGEHVQRTLRPLRMDGTVTVDVALLGIGRRSSGAVVLVGARLSDSDGVLEEHDLTAFLPDTDLGAARGAPVGSVAELQRPAADVTDTLLVPTAPDLSRRYGVVADDTSPFHMDDDAARRYGFPGVILHGLCTLAVSVNALIAAVGRQRAPAQVAARFAHPARPGEPLHLEYTEVDGAIAFISRDAGGRHVLRHGFVRMH